MRLDEYLAGRDKPTISFELFPARGEKAEKRLGKAIDKLAALGPDFVSVTFGAGGSTREGSLALARRLVEEKRLEVLPYFACYGLGSDDIVAVVEGYRSLGVESLLAVRGDEPREEGFEPHPESLSHASDLVTFLAERFDLCLGVAGYPEGHVQAESRERDVEFLKLKVERGARFVIANYFYDNQYFFDFVERARSAGVEVPILAGLMPVYNVKMMRNLAAMCGATITGELEREIAALPGGDKGALNDFGVEFATVQARGLVERGVDGIHIYTMDRAKSAVGVVTRLREEGLV